MFDQERHEEINDGLIEGEDLTIDPEEEKFLSEQNAIQEALDHDANPLNIN